MNHVYEIRYERGDYDHLICHVATHGDATKVCNHMNKSENLESWERFYVSTPSNRVVYNVEEAIDACISDREYYEDM